TVGTDLLFGFLKGLTKEGGARSEDLKLVVMSATVEISRMLDFLASPTQKGPNFHLQRGLEVGVCKVPGRQFPVDTFYTPEPVLDYVDAALRTIFQIRYSEPMPGDILVFLTGQEEIEGLAKVVIDYALQMDKSLPKVRLLLWI